jgi:NADH:ubiquinone oxidoreductase subunit 4 (subunit M)
MYKDGLAYNALTSLFMLVAFFIAFDTKGAMTLSLMTLNITTISVSIKKAALSLNENNHIYI